MFGNLLFGGISPSKLNFEQIVDIYFWDTDFLLDQNITNKLSIAQKDEIAISPVVFSIANNLAPHADELLITETIASDTFTEVLYKSGKPYPFLDEIED